jgi:D-glycero-alpha-D-manno-heptose 1-phosphate guanylyltransferase
MHAVVLAGGLGTRLRGVIGELPKPLADIAGRPFLAHLLDRLAAAAAVDGVVLSVGHGHRAIRDAFGEHYGRLPLVYAVEATPLGTGGGLRRALALATGKEGLVLNGDSLVDVDVAALIATHRRHGRPLTLTAVHLDEVGRYGALRLDAERLVGFAEKTAAGPGWINAGVYVIERDLFERWALPERFSFEAEILVARLAEIRPAVHRTAGFFIDIGVPDDYARARARLAT